MKWFQVEYILVVIQCASAIPLTDMVNKPLNRLLSYYAQDINIRHRNLFFDPKAAKNVILFLIEGLDSHTMSIARQIRESFSATNNYMTTLDYFVSGHLKPSSRDFVVADPAAATSAIFNGLPEYNGQMGWVEQGTANCQQFDKSKKLLKNLFKVMSEAGKRTALFTTSRLTSPGVAGTYAASPDMQIESDIHLIESGCNDGKFQDIASQLIKDYKDLNIIVGSGRNYFMQYNKNQAGNSSMDQWRTNIDLKSVWAMDKVLKKRTYKDAVGTKTVVDTLNKLENTQHFLGFLDEETDKSTTENLPGLLNLVVNALSRKTNSNGYFLTVYDRQLAKDHVTDAVNLGNNLNNILKAINYLHTTSTRPEDTLILVASVQGSTLTLRSGRLQEENILDMSFSGACEVERSQFDYACESRSSDNTTIKTGGPDMTGGPDLPVFARGPGALAFTGINDFPYLYHAILYATCLYPGASRMWEHCMSAPPQIVPPSGDNTTQGPNIVPATTAQPPATHRPIVWPWVPQPLPHKSENPYGNLGVPYRIKTDGSGSNPNIISNANGPSPNINVVPIGTSPSQNTNTNRYQNPSPNQVQNVTTKPILNGNSKPNTNPNPNANQNPNANPNPRASEEAPSRNPNSVQNPWNWASFFPFFL